jgi:hypothetical protein
MSPRRIAGSLVVAMSGLGAWSAHAGVFGDAMPSPGGAAASAADVAPLAQAADSTGHAVTLVIHTAKDCPVCAAWRASASGLPAVLQLAQSWPRLHLAFVEREHLYGGESESLYPAGLTALYQERRDRYQLSPPVPLFEIVLDDRIVSRRAGMSGWTDGTLVELRGLQSSTASPMPK